MTLPGLLVLVVLLASCGRSTPPGTASSGSSSPPAVVSSAPVSPMTPAVADLWARARDGEADDLSRLAAREGVDGLIERAALPAFRSTALRALGVSQDLTPLVFLADVADGDNDAEALLALDSIVELASAPRVSADPADTVEVREGCDHLLALAKSKRASARRVVAIRALRMLVDRGCSKREDIPGDLDAR